mmetsp:Transcript_28350/g.56683  ORF Transcript_28350/g.56683 Transcript_28350/m.56683 type:complete len:203 (+) Transcript_28350:619-1227(+)
MALMEPLGRLQGLDLARLLPLEHLLAQVVLGLGLFVPLEHDVVEALALRGHREAREAPADRVLLHVDRRLRREPLLLLLLGQLYLRWLGLLLLLWLGVLLLLLLLLRALVDLHLVVLLLLLFLLLLLGLLLTLLRILALLGRLLGLLLLLSLFEGLLLLLHGFGRLALDLVRPLLRLSHLLLPLLLHLLGLPCCVGLRLLDL